MIPTSFGFPRHCCHFCGPSFTETGGHFLLPFINLNMSIPPMNSPALNWGIQHFWQRLCFVLLNRLAFKGAWGQEWWSDEGRSLHPLPGDMRNGSIPGSSLSPSSSSFSPSVSPLWLSYRHISPDQWMTHRGAASLAAGADHVNTVLALETHTPWPMDTVMEREHSPRPFT